MQDSEVLGRMPRAQACVTVGPRTQQEPWEGYGAGQSPYQPWWQMHCPQMKSPCKLHLGELDSSCCKRRKKRHHQMGSAAPKTISGIRKADQGAKFCPQDSALPKDNMLCLVRAVMKISLARLSNGEGSSGTHTCRPMHSHPRLAWRRTRLCNTHPHVPVHKDTRHR